MMKNFVYVCRELLENRERILRLARYEQRAKNSGTILGRMWDFLTPVLQICVYWFVFSVGMKMRTMDGETPYAVWMMTGMMPWFCLSAAMQASANAINSAHMVVKNLHIPLTIIPAKTVVIHLTEHLWTMGFLVFVLLVSGVQVTVYWLQTIYFFLCMVIFLMAFALAASAVGAVVKDFSRLLAPIIRLLFYVSSVILSLDGMSPKMQTLLKINPLTYIIMGYRNSLLYGVGFWEMRWHSLCFWVVTLLLLLIGCTLHMRTRERYVDLL